jgi:hypothetical protein
MSDDWGDIKDASSSRGVPIWLWGCGGGCLLLIILAVSVGFLGYRWVKEALDPEKIWEKIALVLPYDERPADFVAVFGNEFPFTDEAMYVLASDPEVVEDEAERVYAVFWVNASEEDDIAPDGVDEPFDLEVQGATFEAGRYTLGGDEAAEMQFDFGELRIEIDQIYWVVLSPAALGGNELVLWVGRDDDGEPITDDEIRAFLAPFEVGPDR